MRKFFVQGTMYSLFSYNRLFQNKIHTPYTDLDLQLYQYMNIHLQDLQDQYKNQNSTLSEPGSNVNCFSQNFEH